MILSLRPWPWPYRAALSVCSDVDGTSPADFEAIHTFLNTDRQTPMGRGLQLNLADSCWFFQHPDAGDRAFAYFDGLTDRESPHAPALRDWIREGWIDTLHSWGNFSGVGGFTRALAEQALGEMEKHRLRLSVWVNHGDDCNIQNIAQRYGRSTSPEWKSSRS